jgi:hypothetical protein
MKAFNGILAVVLGVVALNVPRSALSQISLVSIGRTNDGGYASAVTVSGNYTYLANASDGLRTYDVSNPAHPVRVAQTNNGAAAFGATLCSNLLFVAQDHYGLGIYDLSNPASPSLMGQVTNDDRNLHSMAVVVSSNCVWLANANSGLWACDISDPADPLVVCQTTAEGGILAGTIVPNRRQPTATISCRIAGTMVLNLEQVPIQPRYRRICRVETVNGWRVC